MGCRWRSTRCLMRVPARARHEVARRLLLAAAAVPLTATPSAPYLLHEPNSGAEVKGVAFPRGDHTYVVMHFLGGRPVTEELSISVQRNGSPTALLKCATRSAPVGDLPALFEQLRAGGMRVVQP